MMESKIIIMGSPQFDLNLPTLEVYRYMFEILKYTLQTLFIAYMCRYPKQGVWISVYAGGW